ncbi:phage integrase SAM-like domain-containing protein [Hymenobacter negativus]|uniref:Phage integrase SAM-like domain-containing protein n=1 Tax=Hymenobacter negativus TaxID=2795026 RepID=A0ABS0Q8P8_9BACT|nr:phage integrase SAM-like domain-containing protein [Hymenobacter negativus]MBH8558955.1 phage integrase SAM-like domain-containing protein [Hymenobacter negativus]
MKLTYRQVLSRPDADGRCRIVVDVAWEGLRVKLPTGVSCRPAHFSPEARQVVQRKDPDATRLNNELAKVEGAVNTAFTLASAENRLVTEAELKAVARAALGKKPAGRQSAPEVAAPTTALEFYALWQAENPDQTYNSARRYRQVVGHLEAYHPNWKLTELARKDFLEYLAHLAALGLVDSTVSKHVKFLRECFRLAGKPLPAWLKIKTRYGRAPALQQHELRALMVLELTDDDLRAEAALFTFQTLLLLRDSDLRALRPHHVRLVDLPGYPATPVLTFHQAKTGDEVRVPLPPAAAVLWHGWEGQPPVPVQQERNRRMKQLARVAQLTRSFVRVQYVRGEAAETVLPLYKVITTHTARHTGADMVMLGSGGDSNLKEKALGHAGVYGHDALERYGPALLRAWEKVLGAPEKNAPTLAGTVHQPAPSNGAEGVVFRRVSYR